MEFLARSAISRALFLGAIYIFGGIIQVVFRTLIGEEVKAWLPLLISRLTLGAVKHLPAEEQERYKEEWTSAVAEIPGNVCKVLFALDLYRASFGIRRLKRQPLSPVTRLAMRLLTWALRRWSRRRLLPNKNVWDRVDDLIILITGRYVTASLNKSTKTLRRPE